MKNYYYDKIDERNKGWHEKSYLLNLFYKMKFGIAIKYADIKEDDIILDFGCGDSWLKKRINQDVIGYDIDPKLSDIEDYKIECDKIFAIDVFEHIEKSEIRNIIRNFKKVNKEFALITIIPTETWLWSSLRKIMGLSPTVEDHITKLKDILGILKEELIFVKKTNQFTLSYIAKFKWRSNGK